ncbi:hypothetical protein DRW03_09395 [Corallococcus sp. H22C18031201]|uniref:AgmX/PglI C-terminal domain-containing protein n=1 Tax=Citreicoccus inhibens TaxID=2849499 RepID=UPI000E70F220|nr:AgmX/PglI C-terminal domain-containing protein [Citreicoccus inhibens]MBU8894727.1 AgmX/PglI C-terminal domain-containing protein [Citreicoccus inhibens]RJS25300.1 hypothetical protein DRW03_09395 [Corallococcus sp. H22C18031201]
MTRSLALAMAVLLSPALALGQGAPAKHKTAQKAPARQEEALDVGALPFTPDSIQQVILHHKVRIQECYEDHLVEKGKKVEGKLMTSFTITPDGLVKDAKVVKKASTLKDAGLNDCVVAVLMSMSFPKPTDGRDHPIEYPFNLKAIE